MVRVAIAFLLLALGAAAINVCTGSSSDSNYHNCQMGWSTQHSSGAATGGEGASSTYTYTCATRKQFVSALKATASKRIIYVKGTIRADDLGDGTYAGVSYYQTTPTKNTWSPTTYLKTLSTTGLTAFRANMETQIMFAIPSSTSIIGVGTSAKLLGFYFTIISSSNIIIRNVYIETPQDITSEWSSDDGWNAEFDGILIQGSTRIWIDHVTMTDGRFPDSSAGTYQGEEIIYHDGMIDIKKQSDYITLSNSIFEEHDKTFLIGHSDSYTSDAGYLRITFYGNIFTGLVQRQPRVRFGKVHLLENYYVGSSVTSYFIGMAKSCNIMSSYNMFSTTSTSKIVKSFTGTNFKDTGSWVNGASGSSTVNSVATSAGGSGSAGFTVSYKYVVPSSYATALAEVKANAGSGMGTFSSHKRTDYPNISSCNPTRNCSSSQTCGSFWDGCMMIACGYCPQGSICNGKTCDSKNTYIDDSYYHPVNVSDYQENTTPRSGSAFNDDADDGENWVDPRYFPMEENSSWSPCSGSSSDFIVKNSTVHLADNSNHLLQYSGVKTSWISETGITNTSVSVSCSSGVIGIGMGRNQSAGNHRIDWLLNVSGSSATSLLCTTESGVQSCITTGTFAWSQDQTNNFSLAVSNGDVNMSAIAHLNGIPLSDVISNISKRSLSTTGNVFIFANNTKAASFSDFGINSGTVVRVNTSSCISAETLMSFTTSVLGHSNLSARAHNHSACSSRRAGEAAFTSFEMLIMNDLDTMTPATELASVFADTAITQGVAAAQGIALTSIEVVAPTTSFLAASTAAAAGASTAALSTGAIIGIAVGCSVGGVVVVSAAAAGVAVAVKKSSRSQEPKQNRSAVRMELSTVPTDGINVMDLKGGNVHTSITARSVAQ